MEILSPGMQGHLEALLQRKLRGIPKYHLPDITLAAIINRTPTATHLPNIPPDLQLPYLLANRIRINRSGRLAIKDSSEQPLNLTRAIFFYRLSPTHQFQRYHDTHRWNVAIFLALLTVDHTTADPSFRLNWKSKAFIVAYLEAVMEHHNFPTNFSKREAFIRMWKKTDLEFFMLRPSQGKIMKGLMKGLTAEWEGVLDKEILCMGRSDYEMSLGRFVGVLIPGRQDQKVGEHAKPWQDRENVPRSVKKEDGEDSNKLNFASKIGRWLDEENVVRTVKKEDSEWDDKKNTMQNDKDNDLYGRTFSDDLSVILEQHGTETSSFINQIDRELDRKDIICQKNELLDALMVPLGSDDGADMEVRKRTDEDHRFVVSVRTAIEAVQTCSAASMLTMLLERFA